MVHEDGRNVLANGGPLATIAILYYISHNDPIFMLSFVGSISFALSDTIATELGLLSKVKPRSLLTGKQIDKGQSGGVTIQGEIAALMGSLINRNNMWTINTRRYIITYTYYNFSGYCRWNDIDKYR